MAKMKKNTVKVANTRKGADKAESSRRTKVGKVEKFAKGLSFKKLFFIFLIGSVIGAYYEQGLHFVQTWWETGTPVWSLRRGVIYGPFNVIYGFGAAIMVYLLARKPRKNWQIFLYAALLGGVVEYVISFLQQFFTHTMSWDYSTYPLNINGRTTIPFMVVWGILGLILVRVIYPSVSNAIESIPPKWGERLFIILLVFITIDMFVSWTALIRQTMRQNHIPPLTPVGRFYDAYYTDEFLYRFFPNMTHLDSQQK